MVFWHPLNVRSIGIHTHITDLLVKFVDVSSSNLHLLMFSFLAHVDVFVLGCTGEAREPSALLLFGLFLLKLFL